MENINQVSAGHCPTCYALPDEFCRAPNGGPARKTHKARLTEARILAEAAEINAQEGNIDPFEMSRAIHD